MVTIAAIALHCMMRIWTLSDIVVKKLTFLKRRWLFCSINGTHGIHLSWCLIREPWSYLDKFLSEICACAKKNATSNASKLSHGHKICKKQKGWGWKNYQTKFKVWILVKYFFISGKRMINLKFLWIHRHLSDNQIAGNVSCRLQIYSTQEKCQNPFQRTRYFYFWAKFELSKILPQSNFIPFLEVKWSQKCPFQRKLTICNSDDIWPNVLTLR